MPQQPSAAHSRSWGLQVVSRTQQQQHRSVQFTETMEDAMGMLHKQEKALRAVETVAVSGFAVDSKGLKASCLTICNTCRECVPLGLLRIDVKVPSTLLAVIWPDLVHAEDPGASRVLHPKQVLKLNWKFDDPTSSYVVESGESGVEKEKYEGNDEAKGEEGKQREQDERKVDTKCKDEEEEEEEEEEVERGQVTAYNIDMNKVLWPKGVKEISLGRFNRPVDGVAWPESLEVLSFHMPSRLFRGENVEDFHRGIFNRPLDAVAFPAGLREIFLGVGFNQCIDGVAWPEGLERLSLPGFNQPIQNVQWPSGLKTLEFVTPYQFELRQLSDTVPWYTTAGGFDQPLSTFLPIGLETLWLSDAFKQPLRGVTWPNGLAVLGLGVGVSKESMDGVKWPPKLQKLVVSSNASYFSNVAPGFKVINVREYSSDDDHQHECDCESGWGGYDEESEIYGWYPGDYVDYANPYGEFS